MESVSTEQQRLDGSTVITFKEEGTERRFPAGLISDGTIYALCIMAALMTEQATIDHPVFITTHSESVVRSTKAEQLWLVNKTDGRTKMKSAADNGAQLGDMNLDTAWLMNFFNGGLPW